MGKDTVGFDLGSKSLKQKRKNSSSAPKSALAAKESEFEDCNGVLRKKKVLLPFIDSPREDEPESESDEEEERSPSSDKGVQKEKTKKKKLLVEKNDGSDSESHEEEQNSEPEQTQEKENNSKSGEEKGKGSSSDDEDTDENQNKALQKSDEFAAEEEEAASEDEDTDGKQNKPLVDSDGSSAVKNNAAAQEAKQRPRTRSSSRISEDTVPKNITPAKRTAETDDGTQPQTKPSKRVARKIEDAQDESIKPFQRRWSEKDETILLKGIIKHCKAKNLEISMVDTQGLVDFIRDSCPFHFQPNRRQLTDKIWKMKRKYEKNSKRADHSNMVPHEIKIFNLSRQVWGYLNDDRVTIEARKEVKVEIDAEVRDAPQQSEVDEQLKEFRFRQCELCLKKLELMKEETLLNLEISRFSSSVNKYD